MLKNRLTSVSLLESYLPVSKQIKTNQMNITHYFEKIKSIDSIYFIWIDGQMEIHFELYCKLAFSRQKSRF